MGEIKIRQGSLTIFMTLILGLLVTLTCTALLAVRMAAARTQILCGMDIGLYSVFAGYDRDLLQEYELFFLDGGYGGEQIQEGKICDTFRDYMEPVLLQNYQSLLLTGEGMTGYTLATDANGALLHEQAVSYMKRSLGVSAVKFLLDKLSNQQTKTENALQLWDKAGETNSLNSYEQEITRASHESQEASEEASGEYDLALPEGEFGDGTVGGGYAPVVVNPIPIVQQLWRRGLLSLVLPWGQTISDKRISYGQFLSERRRNQGSCSVARAMDTSLSSRILFHEYVLEKMGDYSEPSGRELDYETEYILYGRKSDEENLNAVAKRLLLVREGLNLYHLLTDAGKNSEAEILSIAIASGFLIPPAAGIIKAALLLCWSFAESILDLQTLFRGGKVPAIKTAESWQISLVGLATFWENQEFYRKGVEDGLSYTDYLRILLLAGEERSICLRSMDCIEVGMRAKGKKNFRLDTCIGEAGIWANVLANGRKVYSIEREYAY